MKNLLILTIVFLFSGMFTYGQILLKSTDQAYSQNFNSLKTSKNSTLLPTGWKIHEKGDRANTSYAADDGNSFAGNTYSYGTGIQNDRALGMLNSGSLVAIMGVQFKNATGKIINVLTITYTGEQWRCGTAGRQDKMDFQYSTNATSLSSGTWIDVNALDFSSPYSKTKGAQNGNAPSNRTDKTETVSGLNIPENATFWFRWVDADASGFNDGLAVDDFSLKVSSENPK